jgi:hypothetical protein
MIEFFTESDLNAETIPSKFNPPANDNPQAAENGIETNAGIEFPGLQVDMFAKTKILEYQKTGNSLNKVEYMVAEVAADVTEKPKFIFKYDTSIPEMGKCENCFSEKVLKVKCPCGKVSYCTADCR